MTAKLARTIASNAPLSVAAMKLAVRAGRAQRAFAAPGEVARAAEQARTSEDVKEGLRAILEKRRPIFHGR
jgi:enoyl-CoA hydratase/carnithine racemase